MVVRILILKENVSEYRMREIKRQCCRHRQQCELMYSKTCLCLYLCRHAINMDACICIYAYMWVKICISVEISNLYLLRRSSCWTHFFIPHLYIGLGTLQKWVRGLKEPENQEIGCEVVSSRYNMKVAPMKLQK